MMDNPNLSQPESDNPPTPEVEFKPKSDEEVQAAPNPDEEVRTEPTPTSPPPAAGEATGYVNEHITHAYGQVKTWSKDAKEYYERSPRLKRFIYQGKFKPAFWTVTAIFSLFVNILFIALLMAFSRYFFEFKSLLAGGLVEGMSNNLALMDKAHIVTTVPVQASVQVQQDLPIVFDVAINEDTQVTLAQDTRIPGAYIYLNNTAVQTDLDLPAGTPLNFSLNTTVPVSQSVPLSMTIPVSVVVPVDMAVSQTDLHQSIVGMKDDIEPYRKLLGSAYNSPGDFPLCNQWYGSWLCAIIFGKQ